MQELIAAICTAAGYQYRQHRQAGGGDINSCYFLSTTGAPLFLKLNDAKAYPLMFQREAEGLAALSNSKSLKIPVVIKFGIEGSFQYLLMEQLEKGNPPPAFWQDFAAGLASLHKNTAPRFGWENENYIGSLPQSNKQHASWAAFYANERILPLVKILYNSGHFFQADIANAGILSQNLDEKFPPEAPSLLHGDLWSGNYIVTTGGKAAIYDPAVYYGHREMDLGMTLLFGGFSAAFYEAYNEVFPLEKQWKERVALTQLYPLLVHAVLFGGGYILRCREIIKNFC